MASKDNKGIPGTDYSHLAKPDMRTSRRNFIAAASTVASAGILLGVGLAASPARAQSAQGCLSSSNQPNGCEPEHHCFLSGTRIATPDGEVAIDQLRIGDLVMSSGGPKPIKWIGRNHYTRAPSEAWNPELVPVKVSRFALDGLTPHADLYLSAGHALYLHGLLIPVKDLVNGRSVVAGKHDNALTLDYFHIELEDHDVILAEGAAAETFGGDSRSGFDNAEEYERLYGSTAGPKRTFAPVVSLNGGRQELRSRLRSAISPIYDARQPLDIIRDQIASRAELNIAA
jgi:Hint domain